MILHIRETHVKTVDCMAKIKTEKQYKAACARIEELLKVVTNETPTDNLSLIHI